ncbi:MAG: hypothetical protein Q4G08_07450 [Capnocytophaga sp.]|nr:hypothetical protein [Capnocytophaga sp.]
MNLTTYLIKGKALSREMIFKYDLNGDLRSFEITLEPLDDKQKMWLFSPNHFPSDETKMKVWMQNPNFKKVFEVKKIPADLSFDNFWQTYGKHGTKSVAKKKFDKLKEHEVIKAFVYIAEEQKKKKLDGTAMPYAETYLNQKRWEV